MTPNADHAAETTITLTDKFVASVTGAAEAGRPLVVAYVHESGGPHLSIRGTVQVLGQHRLALWSRRSSVPQSISANPRLELLYQNLSSVAVAEAEAPVGRGRDDSRGAA